VLVHIYRYSYVYVIRVLPSFHPSYSRTIGHTRICIHLYTYVYSNAHMHTFVTFVSVVPMNARLYTHKTYDIYQGIYELVYTNAVTSTCRRILVDAKYNIYTLGYMHMHIYIYIYIYTAV